MSGVVVGVDRSATARAAAEQATAIATKLGEPLHVVMAVKSGRSQVVTSVGDSFFHDFLSEARAFLRDLVAQLGAPDATISIGGKDPARSVCEEPHRLDASLIVVGNRRTQGAARALGSVATDVLKQAPCDVLVAHTADAGETAAAAASSISPAGANTFGASSAKLFERCTKRQRRDDGVLVDHRPLGFGRVTGREYGEMQQTDTRARVDVANVVEFDDHRLLALARGSRDEAEWSAYLVLERGAVGARQIDI